MCTEKKFLQEKNLMNSSCEALLKLKIMPNTEIRAPSLTLFIYFLKCFFLNTVFLVPANGNKWAASSNLTTCWVSFPKPSHLQIPTAPAGSWGQEGREDRVLWNQSPGVQEPQGALHLISPQTPTMQARSDLEMQLRGTFPAEQVHGTALSCLVAAFHSKHQHFPAEKQRIHYTKASVLTRLLELALHVTQE